MGYQSNFPSTHIRHRYIHAFSAHQLYFDILLYGPEQLNYIEKVTSALLNGTNALLESPTGTGKTLCLLCGSLAWHTYNKSRLPKAPAAVIPLQYEGSDGPTAPVTLPGAVARGIAKPSVIIYASRTHAQLAQVVSELRASGYTPRMSVLGSREQLCIHGRISKLRGSALNHACNSASASRACTYKNNLESYKGGSEGVGDAPSPILDIEQLNELGRKDQICPYFFSRLFLHTLTSRCFTVPHMFRLTLGIIPQMRI